MAVTFTGTTYLSTTNVPAGLDQNTAAHTLACWVYATNNSGSLIGGSTNSSSFVAIVGSTTSGSGFQDASWIGAYEPNDLVNWDQEASNFAEEVYTLPGLTMPLNQWAHIAGTFDGTNAEIFVNGVSQGTMSGGGVATAVAWNRIVIGGFNGDAQDAYVFNRALSAAEIGLLKNGRLFPGIRANLVGYWPLLGGGNSTLDASGNGRTLTATGSCPDATRNAPVPWNTPGVLSALRSGARAITGAGSTQVTGAASATAAAGIVGTGVTNVTGAASMAKTAPLVASGLVQVTGAASMTKAAGLAGSGLVQVTGAASIAKTVAPGSSTGATNVTGAANLSSTAQLVASGLTATTGAAAMTAAAPITAAGLVQTLGAANLQPDAGAFGSTAVIGSAAATSAAAISGSGATQVSGSASMVKGADIPSSGSTQVNGAAVLLVTFPLVASGLTQVTGAALMTSSAGGGGLAAGNKQEAERRWLGALGARRKSRR